MLKINTKVSPCTMFFAVTADAMQREAEFVQRVLAPHLGGCCRLAVTESATVQVPLDFLQQLQQQQELSALKFEPGVLGLLLPDVTMIDKGDVDSTMLSHEPCTL